MLDYVSNELLGLGSKDLTVLQMSSRAVVVYICALAMVRLGHKRFLGKSGPIDFVLAVVLGSVISRAITGNAPFFPALAACVILVAMHWIFTALAFHAHWFGILTKGKPTLLMKDGRVDRSALRETHVSDHDLLEALRTHGGTENSSEVEAAYLERNGNISVIKRAESD